MSKFKQLIRNPAKSLTKNKSLNRKTKTLTGDRKPKKKTSHTKRTQCERCPSAGILKLEQVIRSPTEGLPPESRLVKANALETQTQKLKFETMSRKESHRETCSSAGRLKFKQANRSPP